MKPIEENELVGQWLFDDGKVGAGETPKSLQ
jgi:hypothetical protein